jgi:hypothetical protein
MMERRRETPPKKRKIERRERIIGKKTPKSQLTPMERKTRIRWKNRLPLEPAKFDPPIRIDPLTGKKKMGTPGKFSDTVTIKTVKQVYNLTLLGAKDEDLALAFDVTVGQIEEWKRNQRSIRRAILRGRSLADSLVARSLYHRARGYSCPETHVTVYKDKETGQVQVIKTDIIKHYPPDVTACTYWLGNRQRPLWRDVRQHEMTGPGGGPMQMLHGLDLGSLTDAELQMAVRIGLKPPEAVRQLPSVSGSEMNSEETPVIPKNSS